MSGRTGVESIGISQSSVPPDLCFILGISPTATAKKLLLRDEIVHLESADSDTVAFLPLPSVEWEWLVQDDSDAVARHFATLSADQPIIN